MPSPSKHGNFAVLYSFKLGNRGHGGADARGVPYRGKRYTSEVLRYRPWKQTVLWRVVRPGYPDWRTGQVDPDEQSCDAVYERSRYARENKRAINRIYRRTYKQQLGCGAVEHQADYRPSGKVASLNITW